MKHTARGMTLVEVVVAVALLGIGIAACTACIGSAARASARAEEFTALQFMAREKLAEIAVRGAEEGEATGDFGPERPGYTWRTEAHKSETPGLLQVRLTLLWGDPEHPHAAAFTTYARSGSLAGARPRSSNGRR